MSFPKNGTICALFVISLCCSLTSCDKQPEEPAVAAPQSEVNYEPSEEEVAELKIRQEHAKREQAHEARAVEERRAELIACMNDAQAKAAPSWAKDLETTSEDMREIEQAREGFIVSLGQYDECRRTLESFITPPRWADEQEYMKSFEGIQITEEQAAQRRVDLTIVHLKAMVKIFTLKTYPKAPSYFFGAYRGGTSTRVDVLSLFLRTAQEESISPQSVDERLTTDMLRQYFEIGFAEVADFMKKDATDSYDKKYQKELHQKICTSDQEDMGGGSLFKYSTAQQREMIGCSKPAPQLEECN